MQPLTPHQVAVAKYLAASDLPTVERSTSTASAYVAPGRNIDGLRWRQLGIDAHIAGLAELSSAAHRVADAKLAYRLGAGPLSAAHEAERAVVALLERAAWVEVAPGVSVRAEVV